MSVKQRGNPWTVSVNREGNRYRKGGFDTKKDALTWEQTINRMLDRGLTPDVDAIRIGVPTTLSQLQIMTEKTVWRGQKGERTAVTNSLHVVRILGDNFSVADLDTPVIIGLTAALRSEGLDNGTVNRKLAALSRMITLALDTGALNRRPKITRLKEKEGRLRFLSTSEEKEMLYTLFKLDNDIGDLCQFLLETGCRSGEALKLRWSDVLKDSIVLKKTKSGKPRTVPMTVNASAVLRRRKKRSPNVGPFNLVIQSRLNAVWNTAKACHDWAKDDVEVVPHCLRHTCASRLAMADVHLIRIMRWMGHSSITQTMRYAHLAPQELETAREQLEHFKPE